MPSDTSHPDVLSRIRAYLTLFPGSPVSTHPLMREAVEEIERSRDREQRIEHAEAATRHKVEQILGKALGYPWYKDDQKNFPGATEADGVCVGEADAEAVAEQAAERIVKLTEELAFAKGIINKFFKDVNGLPDPAATLDWADKTFCEKWLESQLEVEKGQAEIARLRSALEDSHAENERLADLLVEANNRADEAATAEIDRLSANLGEWERVGAAIMLCAVGREAPLSDSDVCGEIQRLQDEVGRLKAEMSKMAETAKGFAEDMMRSWMKSCGEAIKREREACAVIAESQEFFHDTHTGMRQQWVKDQIAAKIRSRGQA